ncbi:hypothetical protein BGY98DRAFT_985066, partial [Russula aff. rugulosa BPL654]
MIHIVRINSIIPTYCYLLYDPYVSSLQITSISGGASLRNSCTHARSEWGAWMHDHAHKQYPSQVI